MGIHQALWVGGGATEDIIIQPPLAPLITYNGGTYTINSVFNDFSTTNAPGFFSITFTVSGSRAGQALISYPGVGVYVPWYSGATSQIANLWVRFVALSGVPPVFVSSFGAQTFNVWYRLNGDRSLFLNGVDSTTAYSASFRIDWAESSGGSVIKSSTVNLNFNPNVALPIPDMP